MTAVTRHHAPYANMRYPSLLTFVVIGLWFLLLLKVGDSGLLKTWPGVGPFSALQCFMFAPIALFVFSYALLSHFRDYINSLDPVLLAALQIARIFGAAHFISWGYGKMAGVFAFAVGGGNTIIAFLALYTVYRAAHHLPGWRSWLYATTFLGITEFVMTILLAIFGFYFQALPIDPDVAETGYASVLELPISIFPTFLIPLFLLFHVATLIRLWRG